ncbi:MAG TPA: PorV/PorQ family protein [Candidatus Eisenbacteria bacterium]|nr:PorV/PorQ family protein [Candidatus Eisenbacteria bacterium]HTK69850.1 PorV/PorQ family protein [Candidatus Eisenbacteria bacterium]
MRSALVLAVLLLLPLSAEGAQIFEKVGTLGGQSLKIGVGARAAAMGEAYVALSDDATAVYWNPAGIARMSGQSISLNHTSWPADILFDQAAYVFNIKWIPGMLGVNVRALTMSRDIVRTTYLPEGTGDTFDAGEWAYGLSYARALTDKFSAGFSVNYVQTGLDDVKGSSTTFDFGTLYDVGVLGAKIGMSIQNIGSDMTFIDEKVKMPVFFRVGGSFDVMQQGENRLIAAAEFTHPPDNSEKLNLGAEYGFHDYLFLRGGYKLNYDTQGLTAGFGVKFPLTLVKSSVARLDYAYQDMNFLGTTHRVSLNIGF